MKMQKEWASFKVTVFLYGIVFLVGLNFYQIHTAFDTVIEHTSLSTSIYITSALSVLFSLYTIYFSRLYIESQMRKHAIHDHDTGLFNKKYFTANLATLTARSRRHENPLSVLFVSLLGLDKKIYDKKTRELILLQLGEVIRLVTRDSDIACRYDKDHVVVLMPFTDKEAGKILENRLQTTLEKQNASIEPKLEFKLITTEYLPEESDQVFIQRAQETP